MAFRRFASRFLREGLIFGLALVLVPCPVFAQWPQFGGPNQNFVVRSAEVRVDWGDATPSVIWEKSIGDGYSGVVVDQGFLYTMHRSDDREVVVCLQAQTGQVVWEHRYAAELPEKVYADFGTGPRATPTIHDGTVYAIGFTGILNALDAKTGAVKWRRELWRDFSATPLSYGYSSSPIVYQNTLIVLLGGTDNAVVALNLNDGSTAWMRHTFTNGYSTPRLVKVDGLDHLVCVMNDALIGLDPATGDLHWSCDHEHSEKSFENIAMPAYGDDGLLFFSSPKRDARTLRLTRNGEKINFTEVWTSRKIRTFHPTTLRVGDFLYGSSGITGPGFLFCANTQTGELPWRERGFATAKLLHADGRLIILDENGDLAIATPRSDGLTVHARWPMLTAKAWTVPTLVGTTLYLRDLKVIKALNIGPASPSMSPVDP